VTYVPDETPDVSVVIVACNARNYVERCLREVAGRAPDIIVVDNGSTDGTAELVRERFGEVRLIAQENLGFARANNEGMRLATGRYFLLLNPDAWPVGNAIDQLVADADRHPEAGVVGPLLLNSDGSLQRSVRGFPSLWRLATEYFFLRKLAPRTRIFNAFYGANFDHRSECAAEWLKGAVLLVRREAVADVGGFDPGFFIFGDDVDFCYRLRGAGWAVRFTPAARFVHVGGVSTRPQWARMQRELLRGHLRFFAKHEGLERAERARKLLLISLHIRGRLFRGERAQLYRDAARWLATGHAGELLEPI
jgi:N-acetylglucosaminyl-diphospho-decaprenol L-rhamnosyltransferase